MAPIERDDLLPRRPPGMGKGLVLAIVAHVLLVVAIAFSVNWSSSDPAGVEAELWSAVPQVAAQRAAAIEPEPAPPPKPEPPRPEPRVEPPPPAPKPAPDPQIAIEKERKEKARQEKEREAERREQERKEQERREKAEQQREAERKKAEQKKAEDRKAEEKRLAEKKRQDAARQAQLDAQRDAQLKRIMAQAGADNGSPSGRGAVTSGPSSTYGGRIRAAVEPNITFFGSIAGNPVAEVEVRQSPDGTITGARLVKSSGVKEWDDAVLRAVEKTQKLPRDVDGRVISPVIIAFRPND